MLEGIGITRAVLVHSNIYGPDNRATTDVLAEMAGLDQVMVRDPARLYGFDAC
jgi:predicted TIM-barrel fold metal-dependent hydrolase